MGWDVNVHATLMMLRDAAHRGRGGVGCKHSCNAGDVTLLVGAGVGGVGC